MDTIRLVAKDISINRPTGAHHGFFHLSCLSHRRTAADAVVGNMFRRVLRLIREAYAQCANQEQSASSHVVGTASLHVCLWYQSGLRGHNFGAGTAGGGGARRLHGELSQLQEHRDPEHQRTARGTRGQVGIISTMML